MPTDTRERHKEAPAVLLPWGMPGADGAASLADVLSLWLGAGAVLLVWTGLALLLTA